MSMAKLPRKQVSSFTLARDVEKCLEQLQDKPFEGHSLSAIVEVAILNLHGKYFGYSEARPEARRVAR